MTSEVVLGQIYGHTDTDTQELGHDIRAIMIPFGEDSDHEHDQVPTQDYGFANRASTSGYQASDPAVEQANELQNLELPSSDDEDAPEIYKKLPMRPHNPPLLQINDTGVSVREPMTTSHVVSTLPSAALPTAGTPMTVPTYDEYRRTFDRVFPPRLVIPTSLCDGTTLRRMGVIQTQVQPRAASAIASAQEGTDVITHDANRAYQTVSVNRASNLLAHVGQSPGLPATAPAMPTNSQTRVPGSENLLGATWTPGVRLPLDHSLAPPSSVHRPVQTRLPGDTRTVALPVLQPMVTQTGAILAQQINQPKGTAVMAPPPPNATTVFLGGHGDQARRRTAMLEGFYEGLPMFHLPAQSPECARGEKEAFDVGIRIRWRPDGRHDLLTPLGEPVVSHEPYLKTVAADIYGYSKGRKPHILKWLEWINTIARLRFLMFEKKQASERTPPPTGLPGPQPPGPGAPSVNTTPPAHNRILTLTDMSVQSSQKKRPLPDSSSFDSSTGQEKRAKTTLKPISIVPVPL